MLEARELARGDRLEDVERRPKPFVLEVAVEQRELLEGGAMEGLPRGASGLARIGQPVVVAFVADHRADDRLELEELLPVPIDERASGVLRLGHGVGSLPDGRGVVHRRAMVTGAAPNG